MPTPRQPDPDLHPSSCPQLTQRERLMLAEFVKSTTEQRQATYTFYSTLAEGSQLQMRVELLYAMRWLLTA